MTRSRPSRATAAGRAYLALQSKARRDRRPTDELLQLYALECFLDRLSRSAHANRLVLKGGVLLAALDTRRPTRDLDFQAQRISNDPGVIGGMIRGIAVMPLGDGMEFNNGEPRTEVIRDEDVYGGVRVSLDASLSSAQLTFHVDVNVGDPIWPAPQDIALPRLLGGEIVLRGCPLAMVYAEKIVTAIARGTANTRWRDFADVYLLTRRHPIHGSALAYAVRRVAEHRGIDSVPLHDVLDGYARLAQSRWAAWRRKYGLEDRLPESFASVLEAILEFSDAAITGAVGGHDWDPIHRRWS